jgi:NADH-quinone oxidoreductase subunit F
VEEHLVKGRPVKKLMYKEPEKKSAIPAMKDIPFFKYQVLRALRNKGLIDPEKIEEYIARDGYMAAAKALTEMTSEEIIKVVKDSGLRGRGGAGFSTGLKWEFTSKARSDVKFMLCNADEGDPGAFMDRAIMEGDPHSVIEGMIIGAKAIGAHKGYIYVRAEYPLAIKRLQIAIEQATEAGLLGKNILGTGFDFELEIYLGAGAFVCGEETALMRSIEGKRGMPRSKPPFPALKGLWDKPTVLNNVETFANIPPIIFNGADWFRHLGTEKSTGTKVFALTGAINNVGLVEVPMGIPLRTIIYDIGGGIKNNRKFKAVQLGGPSGGCIPEGLLDTPVTYEDIVATGAIVGSGGMVVMDDSACMVNLAKFFLGFTTDESCGKCTPCRVGTRVMLKILDRISRGEGVEGDIELLIKLGNKIKDTSLCGLGRSCSNPILTTIKYFRNEYEEHIKYKRCNAMVCKELISSACQHTCPIGTEVPVYVALIARRRFKEALQVIRKDNPLPSVCGRVCSHPCEFNCKLGEVGEPVAIRALKRFAVDYGLKTGEYATPPVKPVKTKNKKVSVIGAGPAGLAAADELCKMGYPVTIFEALPEAGGMMRYGIPEFRLPRERLQWDIQNILSCGIELKTNHKVESIDSLFKDGFDAVFVAVGAHAGKKLSIPGSDLPDILLNTDFLRDVAMGKQVKLKEKVLVLGGGNIAMDVARTAVRLGAREVRLACLESRNKMPADPWEIEDAENEGVVILPARTFIEITSQNGNITGVKCSKINFRGFKDGRPDMDMIEGTEHIIEADTVIFAIGQAPETSFAQNEVELTTSGTVKADKDSLATSRPGVFAGGDAVTGTKFIIDAISAGKKTAESIDRYLQGDSLQREYKLTRPSMYVEPIELTDEEMEESIRARMPQLSPEERTNNFREIDSGLTEEMAVREARQCLRCDLGTADAIKAIEKIKKKKQSETIEAVSSK